MKPMTMDILDLIFEDTKLVILFMKIGHITHLIGATLMNTSSWYPLSPVHVMDSPL